MRILIPAPCLAAEAYCFVLLCFLILLPVRRVYVQTELGKSPLLFTKRGWDPFFLLLDKLFLKTRNSFSPMFSKLRSRKGATKEGKVGAMSVNKPVA